MQFRAYLLEENVVEKNEKFIGWEWGVHKEIFLIYLATIDYGAAFFDWGRSFEVSRGTNEYRTWIHKF